MRFLVVGGAGFIGSHLVQRLLSRAGAEVVVFDNFSSGRMWHLNDCLGANRLKIIRGDAKELESLKKAMEGADVVFHFASNPDIAKAVLQPDIDFWEGTYLTQNVLEAMRQIGTQRLLYASGSGVYGDTGNTPVSEDFGPMLPISTYGASKLAGEALLCAYCHMFDMHGVAFRFANVVGPRQTHGVAYDFIRNLFREPFRLSILGDGEQSKSYIHVQDILDAMLLILDRQWEGFEYYNVATEDYVTVRQIADLVVERMGLRSVTYEFSGGRRGWKGDVPIVRFHSSKIRALGWKNRFSSIEALTDAIDSMIIDAQAGKF
jgi:UDP-glucose 4-epimerase